MISAKSQFTPRGDLGRFVEVRITPGLKAGIEEWDKGVLEISQDLVPVDTGDLRASGKVIPAEESGKTVMGGVSYSMPYAAYVEFGTGIRGAASAGAGPYKYSSTWPGMPAQPYLRPAFDQMKEKAQGILENAISVSMQLK